MFVAWSWSRSSLLASHLHVFLILIERNDWDRRLWHTSDDLALLVANLPAFPELFLE